MNQKQKVIDLSRLTTLRDELALKAHLFDAEMKEQWDVFERDWALVQAELKGIAPEAKRSVRLSSRATARLISRIGESLRRIREGLSRHHHSKSGTYRGTEIAEIAHVADSGNRSD